jgi:hypothetical protein
MCSIEFTVQVEFTVHSAGLSANSVDLSVKSAGWGFHYSNFESNEFRPVFIEFYRIRPIFLKTGRIEGSQFFSLHRFFKHWRRGGEEQETSGIHKNPREPTASRTLHLGLNRQGQSIVWDPSSTIERTRKKELTWIVWKTSVL